MDLLSGVLWEELLAELSFFILKLVVPSQRVCEGSSSRQAYLTSALSTQNRSGRTMHQQPSIEKPGHDD